MCGRYTIAKPKKDIQDRFEVLFKEEKNYRKWNAAPQNELPVVLNQCSKEISFLKWGLVPSWAKDLGIGFKTINARIETLSKKPAFKDAYEQRRCLVIADGYYEWKLIGKEKIPYRMTLPNGELFAMAGLWEKWYKDTENVVNTFAVITRPSVGKLESIHDRMPLILEKEFEAGWLEDKLPTAGREEYLLENALEELTYYTVSKSVNSVANDDESLVKPYQHQVQGSLF
ncbi:SOS response-associated peptidase [Flammeovirgaceae bacterium SG7u.111]|nr:SOS response-associated peptidase [Flammeovirgaceae bacterium SG7u.132]WPO33115.1 SOS response-associated peptidase [Flammeovirgaceae bacterium SG7u.111]